MVWLWNSEVLVSSSMCPLSHELQVVEAAEASFEMAVLQKKISFIPPTLIERLRAALYNSIFAFSRIECTCFLLAPYQETCISASDNLEMKTHELKGLVGEY